MGASIGTTGWVWVLTRKQSVFDVTCRCAVAKESSTQLSWLVLSLQAQGPVAWIASAHRATRDITQLSYVNLVYIS